MNDRIAKTLDQVADGVRVPPLDEVAVTRQARKYRTRRRSAYAVAGLAAAAAVAAVVVPLAVNSAGGSGKADGEQQVASSPNAPVTIGQPAYFSADNTLTALLPDGTTHDFGVRSERVVGSDAERVVALDTTSHLMEYAVNASGGTWTWQKSAAPVDSAVDAVTMSADGRWLAWRDLQGSVHVYDYESDTVAYTFDEPDRALVGVSADGVLLGDPGGGDGLTVRTPDGARVELPTPGGSYGSGLTDGVVVASGMEDSAVYDLVGGRATKSRDLPGTATLSTTGQRIITVQPTAGDDGTVITAWAKGSQGWEGTPVTGVGTRAETVRWLDADTALVSAWATSGGGNDLYACSAEELRCSKLELPHGTGTVEID